jgi:hypothetical protein
MPPISDDELAALLREWKPPDAPRDLEDRVQKAFAKQKPLSWRWWLTGTVRIPVPAGVAAAVLLAGFAVAWLRIASAPAPLPRVAIQTRTVEVPVFREQPGSAADRTRRPAPKLEPASHRRGEAVAVLNLDGFEPVTELRPQIIRRSHE